MNGIVLAGGLATRLPNKALLPLHNGKPAITSGIDFLIANNISDIRIVVPSRSPINHILRMHYNDKHFEFITQREPLGVPMAISEADSRADSIIVYCDNIYTNLEFLKPNYSCHCVQHIEDLEKARHLSKWNDDTNRWQHECVSDWCVAGWMFLTAKDLQAANHFKDTITFLNDIKAQPFALADKNWWDIGTAETYRYYWENFR